ncbi:MAG: SCO family protein [Armatimonadota bacterium]|nr:SCO family protein [Armatimonadota bacterium]
MAGRSFGVLTAVTVAVAWAAGCSRVEPLRGQLVDPPRPLPDLVALDQRGRVFRLADQRGKVILLFFGYTTCPDVCPATLGLWKRARERLGQDAERVRFVFVTVDPERDTAAKVQEYLELFSSDFVGLVGSEAELRAFSEAFGAAYEKVPQPDSATGYLVAHTASVPVVDTRGRWRLRFNPQTSIDDYVHDVRILVREGAKGRGI